MHLLLINSSTSNNICPHCTRSGSPHNAHQVVRWAAYWDYAFSLTKLMWNKYKLADEPKESTIHTVYSFVCVCVCVCTCVRACVRVCVCVLVES